MRIAVFCEAAADFAVTTGLIDRLLREEGPDWVREHVEHRPLDDLREWVGAAPDRPFFDVHRIYAEAKARGIVLPRNNFAGQRGGPGALMAHTAFLVARAEARRSGVVDAVVIVWDMDDQGEARREGLAQGRAIALLPVILGCPDPEREAWVLAGFDPEHAAEHAWLDEERRALGFHPAIEAHRLRDKDDGTPRSPKRVLKKLTDGDPDRESRCWTDAPLATLRVRGEHSGLRAYLDEVCLRLLPLLDRS